MGSTGARVVEKDAATRVLEELLGEDHLGVGAVVGEAVESSLHLYFTINVRVAHKILVWMEDSLEYMFCGVEVRGLYESVIFNLHPENWKMV